VTSNIIREFDKDEEVKENDVNHVGIEIKEEEEAKQAKAG
jgi:hypothetical protein